MRVNIRLVSAMALCCVGEVRGGCASSNVTATAVSPCGTETISFSDAYFTHLAFMDERVRCRGILTKIKYGPLILKPVKGEFRDDEHIVHANGWNAIGVHQCNGDGRHCLCNDDESSWRGLDGKTVIVGGVLSESAPSCSIVSEEFMSPALLDSKISADHGSAVTNNAFPEAKQSARHFEYASPCREFKTTVCLANGGRYIIHYYSAVLWMAYVGPDRLAAITRPFPLYPRLENKKKIRKVWAMLNGLEKHILPSAHDSRHMSVKCRPKRYSQIKSVTIHDPEDALVKSIKNLFDFVYEQQRQKEGIDMRENCGFHDLPRGKQKKFYPFDLSGCFAFSATPTVVRPAPVRGRRRHDERDGNPALPGAGHFRPQVRRLNGRPGEQGPVPTQD